MSRSSGVGQVIPADPVMHASWLTLNSQCKRIFFIQKLYALPRLLYLPQAVLAKERLQREVEREGKEKDEKQQALQESLRSIAEVGK